MNESEKILRLLNQQWDYRHNNNSFASTFIRLYFGKGSDFIYIRNGRPRYRDVLEKLFKRNENKMNFSWGSRLSIPCYFPDELSYMYYLFYILATPMILKSNIMYVVREADLPISNFKDIDFKDTLLNITPYDTHNDWSTNIIEELKSRKYSIPYAPGYLLICNTNLLDVINTILGMDERTMESTSYMVDSGSWILNNHYTEIFYVISHNVFADAVPYPRENLMRKIKGLYGMLLLSRLYVTNILKELNDSRCPDNVKALEECLYYKWLDLVYSIKIGQNVVYAKNHRGNKDVPYLFDNPIISGPMWSHDLRKMLNEDLNVLNSLCSFAEGIYANLYYRVLKSFSKEKSIVQLEYASPGEFVAILNWLIHELYNSFTHRKPLYNLVFPMIPSFTLDALRNRGLKLTCRYGHVVNLSNNNTMSEYYNPDGGYKETSFSLVREDQVRVIHKKMPKVNSIPFLWSDDTFNPLANDPWYKEGIQKQYMLPNDKPEWLGNWSFLSEYIAGIIKWDMKYGTEWSSHLNYII